MPTLEQFDPTRPLVTKARIVRLRGQVYRRNDAIPYDEANHRVLERLYGLRRIGYGEGEEAAATTPAERFLRGGAERRQQTKDAAANAEEVLTKAEVEAQQPTEEEAEAVKKLTNAHNHDDLFKMAAGLKGVKKAMKKDEIALALVRAGRGPA